ncbi:carboxylate-amine ligase [Reichenbachiella ulvae]|uniref:Glutamate-cysteine ligase family protein n=1 Tax=Reichenbachiella ulvae TaxID=2980104 RepID=A0ABT3D095_9BACT|nr:glutamate-cysteine ligase family protein [Reichenbachiella ulvae]MCV9389376.1 glutamate-cysteine ligase family protein [Reichenbachiella ulvae]
MEHKSRWHLFQVYGVELEYMIVDQDSLDVRPIADAVLRDEQGNIQGEMEFDDVAWSNELVSHVIEIKSNGPTADLQKLSQSLHNNVKQINQRLAASGAKLLPSAAHPWMVPAEETKIWEHENQDIYHAYDRIFNCKGHGWSNLQSTHLNLPFYDDEEFSRLHTAIRFILPILPGLTASSPILGGKFSKYMDKRLYYYQSNQSKIPVLTGKVIPDLVYSKYGYQKHIYDRITQAIKPFDQEGIFDPVWLNSRGAIARFDRGAIEIRIMDIQECPQSDLAIVNLVIHLLKLLVKAKWINFETQQSLNTMELHDIFEQTIKHASATEVSHMNYLRALGYKEEKTCAELWRGIMDKVFAEYPKEMEPWRATLEVIAQQGTLAERIMKAVNDNYEKDNLKKVYNQLADCLESNSCFVP